MDDPFVGRDREMADLLGGVRDALEGRGGFFLIAGEPGIGKTALAEHAAARAAEQGARVLWSRSWEDGGAAPYWTWVQLIRALIDQTDDATLRPLFTPRTAHLALLAPEIADRFGDAARGQSAPDSEAGRFYLFEATARFLKDAASIQPLVLVFDDLLAGDLPSLQLLRYFVRDVRASRLLLLATHRHPKAVPPDREELVEDLLREGRLLGLRGLDRDEVGRVVAQVSGVEPASSKVAAIHEATGGNPLFVREVTRLLAGEDPLDRPGRPSIPVPDTVRAVIRRRLAPLSADAILVLSAGAVVGRDFDVALTGPASDLPAEQVVDALAEAVALGVVEVPEVVGRYRFSHPLMREAIYEGLPMAARIQMHQRVGEAMERIEGPDPATRLGELAYHFAQAAATGEATRAVTYARRAADRAMESLAYEEAALQYQRALEALALADADEVLRCDLYLGQGSALAAAGDYAGAKESFASAATFARGLGSPDRLARAALGLGEPQVEGGVVDQQFLAVLQEALDALGPEDGALRARALARFSLELTFSDDEVLRETRREALSREALEMARRLGDPTALATALRARWLAAWGPDGLEERTALSEEILDLARDTGDRDTELMGRARRITCSMEAGDIRAAQTDIAAHARLAGELGMPYQEWTAATLEAGWALLEGSLEEAERLTDEAASLLPGRPNAAYARLDHLSVIRWEQGRLGELRDAWQGLASQFPQAAFSRGWLALADIELGRDEDARNTLRSLVEELPGLPRNGLWLLAVASTTLPAAALEEADAAAPVYPLLLPYADQVIVVSMPHPVMCMGPASMHLGLLAATMARWEEASEHFEAAIRATERLGAKLFLARTRYEYAGMLIRRGRAGDRRRALGLLDRAEPAAKTMGMTVVAEGCQRLRHLEAGSPIAGEQTETGTAVGTRSVFRRDGDYWTVEYDGSLVRLRDAKGLRHLARLLAEPGREFHVLDLEAADGSGGPSRNRAARGRVADLEARADLGDAGELLDREAKAAYKARLEELRSELEEAESWGDPAREEKAREEMEFLARELARAVGLGGRDRRAASHAERARLNATRAIRTAIGNVARVHPALGEHLSSTIRTGRYCSYTPDPRAPIAWES